jgi:hypothetical protein
MNEQSGLSLRDSGIGSLSPDSVKAVDVQEVEAGNDNVEEQNAVEASINQSPEILYEIRYQNEAGEHVYSRPLPRPAKEIEQPAGVEPPVMKIVDVRSTWLEKDAPEFADPALSTAEKTATASTSDREETPVLTEDHLSKANTIKLPPFDSELGSYIEITSPAVLEALRCVIDYAPVHDLGARRVTVQWPYSILAHYDDILAEYQGKFETPNCTSMACPGRNANRHIGIVRKFVNDTMGAAIEDERKRHARGMATFDMLWLLFRPGVDMLVDNGWIGEHQPYVMGTLHCDVLNGTIRSYKIGLWNMRANSIYIGPRYQYTVIEPFAGEVQITSLEAYPFEHRTKSKVWGEREDAREYFEKRGRIFFQLRKQGCWDFRGYTTTFPRRPVSLNVQKWKIMLIVLRLRG